MKKYSLIIEGETYLKKEIIFLYENKKSSVTDISVIDKFTTKYNDEKELKEQLINIYKDVKNIDSIYILDTENKRHEIAYKDTLILKDLKPINNKISTDTQAFKNLFFNFLKDLENKDFYNFICSKTEKSFQSSIRNRICLGDYSNNAVIEISKKIDNYEDVRNLIFLCKFYKVERLRIIQKEMEKKYEKLLQNKTF